VEYCGTADFFASGIAFGQKVASDEVMPLSFMWAHPDPGMGNAR